MLQTICRVCKRLKALHLIPATLPAAPLMVHSWAAQGPHLMGTSLNIFIVRMETRQGLLDNISSTLHMLHSASESWMG